MPTHFFFDPSALDIPALAALRQQWVRVPNAEVRSAIAVEHQYLHFHEHILQSCRFTMYPPAGRLLGGVRLQSSVRAGAIKAKLLLSASIVEAALRAHAEHRNYPFHQRGTQNRTFGSVLCAWSTNGQLNVNGRPRADVAAVWQDLRLLNDARNNVHLYAAADNPNADHEVVVAEEDGHVARATALVTFCQQLESP